MEEWKQRLRQARQAKGLNKTKFANLVKVSNPTVTDWEKSVADGGIKEIAGGNLTKICAVLDVAPQWLMHGGEGGPAAEHTSAVNESVASYGNPPDKREQENRLAESLKLRVETAEELRLLTVYRLANDDGRLAIDTVVEQVRRRLDANSVGLHKR